MRVAGHDVISIAFRGGFEHSVIGRIRGDDVKPAAWRDDDGALAEQARKLAALAGRGAIMPP